MDKSLLQQENTSWQNMNIIYDFLVEQHIGIKINRKRLFEKHNRFIVPKIKESIKYFNKNITYKIIIEYITQIVNIINTIIQINDIKFVYDLSRNFRQCTLFAVGNTITDKELLPYKTIKFWTYISKEQLKKLNIIIY